MNKEEKKYKIGIDARLWDETGVGRYIRNLVKELQSLDKQNTYTLFVLPKDRDKIESVIYSSTRLPKTGTGGQASLRENSNWSIVTANIRWHSVEEQLKFSSLLEKEHLDLMHFPYFSVPIRYNKPFVVTIHDLILHHFPTGKASTLPTPIYYAKHLAYKFIIAHVAKKAEKILTVSKATASEIAEDLHVPTEKIVVTYEGVDTEISNLKSQISNKNDKNAKYQILNTKYFLYVGNAYPHKNLERLIDAFRIMVRDIKLILVGREDFFYKRLKEGVKKMNLEKSIFFEFHANDEKLGSLYHNAIALIQPSLMEGFGLTGLEAMSQNCLVVASNIPSLKEIYKDTAIYFDPKNTLDIAKCLENIYSMQDEEKEKIIKNGQDLIKLFSWKTMAAQTLKVYESCIGV